MYPQRRKSGGVKSGDRGGPRNVMAEREINLPRKASLSIAMVSLAVCGVAPSC